MAPDPVAVVVEGNNAALLVDPFQGANTDDDFDVAVLVEVDHEGRGVDGTRRCLAGDDGRTRPQQAAVGLIDVDLAVQGAKDDVVDAVAVHVADRRSRRVVHIGDFDPPQLCEWRCCRRRFSGRDDHQQGCENGRGNKGNG
jgi:hypothetical protein